MAHIDNWVSREEYEEVEAESIAHAHEIRRLRDCMEKAVEMLGDHINEAGGLDEAIRVETTSILKAGLRS